MKYTFSIIYFCLAFSCLGQTFKEVSSNTRHSLGFDELSKKHTLEYDLVQMRGKASQSMHVTIKGKSKIRTDVQTNTGQFSFIRNGNEYRMESGTMSKDITSEQTKSNLDKQNLILALLGQFQLNAKTKVGEKVLENGRTLVRLTNKSKDTSSVLWIDSDTWLPLRLHETIVDSQGTSIRKKTSFSQYEEFDGIKIPTKQTTIITMPDGQEIKEGILISNVKIGRTVEDTFFSLR